MTLAPADVLALEAISARAWPAVATEALGGWRLNASSGWSDRINACWPLAEPGLALDEAIAATEAWYAGRGLPPTFKLADGAASPAPLPDALAARGYRPHKETIMMIGPADGAADPAVALGETVDQPFAAVFAAAAESPDDARERLGALGRVPRPRALARLDIEGAPAAIGACAAEGDWAGVFAMRTDPAFRRRGLARRVFASLMAFAASAGARRAWLQVEADNHGAVALYCNAGFEEAYRYRYWVKPPR